MKITTIIKYLKAIKVRERIHFCPTNIINHHHHFYEFSTFKDDQTNNKINVSEEQIQKIKNILANSHVEGVQKDGQDFFTKEQIQLSLKIMQIDNIDQLKVHIFKYCNRFPYQNADKTKYDEEMAQIMRCKFMIINKYVNLGGTVAAKQIQPIYRDISQNIKSLDQNFITKFYRIVANEMKSNPHSKLSPPILPLIQNATHTNSELVTLLLMVYPQNEDKIYIHYNLKSKKLEESFKQAHINQQKQIIYDPIHLIHMLKHFSHYSDVQQLLHKSMSFSDFEDYHYQFDELIKTEAQFKLRRLEAINYALIEGLEDIYQRYLFANQTIVKEINISQALILLKNILTIKNKKILIQSQYKNIIQTLIGKILAKSVSFIELSEQQQLEQNQNFKHAVQIVSLFLFIKQQNKIKITTQLIMHLFSNNSAWKIKLQEYSEEQLFSILVCYKGSRDVLKNESDLSIDENNVFLIKLLTNLKEQIQCIGQCDQKHAFYACYFADSYGCVQYLKSQTIQLELLKMSKRKNIKKASLDIINGLLHKFRLT